MLVTNNTNVDYWFGPLHLPAGIGQTLTVDDTTATSLYLTEDAVADAINNLSASSKIAVTSAASPFPRPTGVPSLLHGDGSPDGLVYAPQGSVYMRRDNAGVSTSLYVKTTGVTLNTGWLPVSTGTIAAPTGAVQSFCGTSVPTDWLLCDGAAVSRTTYSTLFNVIATTFGIGDGSSTFNVPDLRGRVIAGYASSGHVDVATIGLTEGISNFANRRPKHRHTVNDPTHQHGDPSPGTNVAQNSSGFSGPAMGNAGNQSGWMTGWAATGITVGTGIASDAVDTAPYLVLKHIIKT
jgi:microcystin-dependent protein